MNKWYFTFGCNQAFKGYCQVVLADSFEEAREKMCNVYGIKWAFQYSESQWKNVDERYKEKLINVVIK